MGDPGLAHSDEIIPCNSASSSHFPECVACLTSLGLPDSSLPASRSTVDRAGPVPGHLCSPGRRQGRERGSVPEPRRQAQPG